MSHSHEDEHLPDDLQYVADALREERPTLDPLALDRVKLRAMSAGRRSSSSRQFSRWDFSCSEPVARWHWRAAATAKTGAAAPASTSTVPNVRVATCCKVAIAFRSHPRAAPKAMK